MIGEGTWLEEDWLPKYDCPQPYDHAEEIYQRMLVLCEEIGVTVKPDGRITGADTDGKLIRLSPKLSKHQRIVSLTHELIHVYLKHLPAKDGEELARAEIQTELILGQLMHRLGFKIDVMIYEKNLQQIPEVWGPMKDMYKLLRPLFFESHET